MTWANYSTSLNLFSCLSNGSFLEFNEIMIASAEIMIASAPGTVGEVPASFFGVQRLARRGWCLRRWAGAVCLREERPQDKGEVSAQGNDRRAGAGVETRPAHRPCRNPAGPAEGREKSETRDSPRGLYPRRRHLCDDSLNYISQEAPGV